jgi:hypothetical protein
MPDDVYAKTIRPLVALLHQEILEFGEWYAKRQLRRPRSRQVANLSDLVPGNDNARDLAVDAFTKLLSGERQDWDGNPETLRQAVGSCINSMLSGRLKRHDNVLTTPIDDLQLDWLYADIRREDPDLEPAEEHANRFCKVKIVRRLLLDKGYHVEAEILSAMIMYRAFHAEMIAERTGLNMKQVSGAFARLASYVQTDEFAIELGKVSGEIVESSALAEIKEQMEDIVHKFKH